MQEKFSIHNNNDATSINGGVPVLLVVATAVAFFFASILVGSARLGVREIVDALLKKDGTNRAILFAIRIPRSITVLLCGLLLGGTGCVMQKFFCNPLADTSIMGSSSAAMLGVQIASVLQTAVYANIVGAVACLLSNLLLVAINRATKGDSTKLLLCGFNLSLIYSAATAVLLLTQKTATRNIFAILAGSFSVPNIALLKVAAPLCVGAVVCLVLVASYLDLFISGASVARLLGVNIEKVTIATLLVICASTSISVALGGVTGYIGLVAPHLAALLHHHPMGKKHVALSCLWGVILLFASDIVSRLAIRPAELPTGIVTQFLGAIFFLSALIKKHR